MVTVTSENNQVFSKDNTRVAISGGRALSFHVEDLSLLGIATEHRRAVSVSHGASHVLSSAHRLVVGIEVGSIMILDKESPLHVV